MSCYIWRGFVNVAIRAHQKTQSSAPAQDGSPIANHAAGKSELTTEQYRREIERTMSEAEFQSLVISMAKARGFRVAHFRGVAVKRKDGSVRYQTPVQADGAGFPDLIMCRKDRCIAAELKSHRGKTAPEQEAWLAALAWADIECYEWRPMDLAEIERVLQ